MADHEPTRQWFEDRCWQHYMAERQRRDLPGDVVDEFPTREQLFWRQPGGAYGVLMFNAAWLAWCWALEDMQPDPIDMVLNCPACGTQHVDEAETDDAYREKHLAHGGFADQWTNPPHRSHLCLGCGHIWRPADVPTNGVAAVKTKGKADSPIGPSEGTHGN